MIASTGNEGARGGLAARRLRSAVRTMGWVNGCTYLFATACNRFSRGRFRLIKYDLLVQPLQDVPFVPTRRGRKLTVRRVEQGDPLLAEMGHSEATIAERFRQGAQCLVALRDGELAGFLWYVEGAYEEDEVRCVFLPCPNGSAIWDFDVFVCPRYRFSSVFAKLWSVAAAEARRHGYAYSCSRISAFNYASRAAHQRLNATVVGRALFLCAGSLQVSLMTERPYVHVSLGRGKGVVLRVGPRAERERRDPAGGGHY